jgi:hypothetical protein
LAAARRTLPEAAKTIENGQMSRKTAKNGGNNGGK